MKHEREDPRTEDDRNSTWVFIKSCKTYKFYFDFCMIIAKVHVAQEKYVVASEGPKSLYSIDFGTAIVSS